MSPLEELQAAGIPVTWSTVRLGLEGPGAAGPQVDLTDVRAIVAGDLDGPGRTRPREQSILWLPLTEAPAVGDPVSAAN
jgi:hypothetical protein